MATNEEEEQPPAVGKEGCQCLDVSAVLASLDKRSCKTSEGEEGILLTVEGPCAPHSYGSNNCLPYDLMHDPRCNTMFDSPDIYCSRPWCYVDKSSCQFSSDERLYRSNYFPREDGVDLFYSYTTCDSSSGDTKLMIPQKKKQPLGGTTLMATSPYYYCPPYMFKRDSMTDEILTVGGDEYYNNSIPFEGVLVNYLNQLVAISDGDFKINYTSGSKVSRIIHPKSSYTATVQDIEDGLQDMAVSDFWVTGERLQMAAFTKPLVHSPVVLVIPRPQRDDSLRAQTLKVLEPFTMWAWFLILAVIIFASLLSVYFSDRSKLAKKKGEGLRHKGTNRRRKRVYGRLALDAFLEQGIFFCSAGVSQDEGASLPHKILMFGFGFFILIVVSAYVANLAAFLTNSGVNEYIGTMAEVNAQGMRVCAQTPLRAELEVTYSSTEFVYSESGTVYGMVDDYVAGRCDFLAVGETIVQANIKLVNLLCEQNLVFTDSVVIENVIAFPIKRDLAPGLAYWIYKGEKEYGITVQESKKEYDDKYGRKASCDARLSAIDNTASDDSAYITPKNLFLPVVFFVVCAILGMMMELYRQRKVKQGKKGSLFGRSSTLTAGLKTSADAVKHLYDEELDSEDGEDVLQTPIRLEDNDTSLLPDKDH